MIQKGESGMAFFLIIHLYSLMFAIYHHCSLSLESKPLCFLYDNCFKEFSFCGSSQKMRARHRGTGLTSVHQFVNNTTAGKQTQRRPGTNPERTLESFVLTRPRLILGNSNFAQNTIGGKNYTFKIFFSPVITK